MKVCAVLYRILFFVRLFHRANEICQVLYVIGTHIIFNTLHDFYRCIGIHEVHGAHTDCTGSRQNEFDGIFRRSDATHADDGNLNCLRHLVYHTNRNGFDGRTAHAAGLVGNGELPAVNVDLHAGDGVDQGQSAS